MGLGGRKGRGKKKGGGGGGCGGGKRVIPFKFFHQKSYLVGITLALHMHRYNSFCIFISGLIMKITKVLEITTCMIVAIIREEM